MLVRSSKLLTLSGSDDNSTGIYSQSCDDDFCDHRGSETPYQRKRAKMPDETAISP